MKYLHTKTLSLIALLNNIAETAVEPEELVLEINDVWHFTCQSIVSHKPGIGVILNLKKIAMGVKAEGWFLHERAVMP